MSVQELTKYTRKIKIHYHRIFITAASSRPIITVGFSPLAVKVVGDKNGRHHPRLMIGYHQRFVLPTSGD
jgi:hypothetical protein